MAVSPPLEIALRHHKAGRLQEAADGYRHVLAIDPNNARAWHFLGVIAYQCGKPATAAEHIEQAVRLEPRYFEALSNLGLVHDALGRFDEAIVCYRRALELKPDSAEAHYNLGVVYGKQRRREEEIACYHRALELKSDYPEVYNNLGCAWHSQGNLHEAMAAFRGALKLKPDFVEALNGLAAVLLEHGDSDAAIDCLRRALELQPSHAPTYNNLGGALKDQAKLDEALACFRKALDLNPGFVCAHDNLVYTLCFSPTYDAAAIYEEHRRWNEQHARPLAKFIRAHDNSPAFDRRLRIGYVSPHFRNHAQAFFLAPLFGAHDYQRFEVYCYSDVTNPDEITERLKTSVSKWRDITRLTDAQVVELVREDKIDILVDLTMHMEWNRLLVFASKPAPIQVCWLAYPGTTGLTAIDYRFTDPYLDPPHLYGSNYSEESVRLADTFWCYDPLTESPAVNALPALERGYVTFGSLNNFCKVNDAVVKLWSHVLQTIGRSQLLLLAPNGSPRQQTIDAFAEHGIAPERIEFVSPRPRPQYLELYHRVDIGLDTLPYNGHTTTMDSLWMGVPVVTIVGQTVVGRAGLSQLSNLGLAELVADDSDAFVRIASEFAGDLERLSQWRATLRSRMEHSPLMDAPRFARTMEAAYRMMWQRWCEGRLEI